MIQRMTLGLASKLSGRRWPTQPLIAAFLFNLLKMHIWMDISLGVPDSITRPQFSPLPYSPDRRHRVKFSTPP